MIGEGVHDYFDRLLEVENNPRSFACFSCSAPVPIKESFSGIMVVLCSKCTPLYRDLFKGCIEAGMPWREANVDVLKHITEEGPLR